MISLISTVGNFYLGLRNLGLRDIVPWRDNSDDMAGWPLHFRLVAYIFRVVEQKSFRLRKSSRWSRCPEAREVPERSRKV